MDVVSGVQTETRSVVQHEVVEITRPKVKALKQIVTPIMNKIEDDENSMMVFENKRYRNYEDYIDALKVVDTASETSCEEDEMIIDEKYGEAVEKEIDGGFVNGDKNIAVEGKTVIRDSIIRVKNGITPPNVLFINCTFVFE